MPCFVLDRASRAPRHERCLFETVVVLRVHARRVRLIATPLALVAALALRFASVPLALAEASTVDARGSEPCGPSVACPLDELPATTAAAAEDAGVPQAATLVFFWGAGCPHCEEAKPFLDTLEKEEPRLRVERVEVRRDPEGRRRFLVTMKQLGATAVGVPTFVVGTAYVVGYSKGESDREVGALVRRALGPKKPGAEPIPARTIDLPIIGSVDPTSVSLTALTLSMGLVDGVNPCAMWVLVVLLGILLHVKTRSRMLLYSAAFIVMSGVVYFVFMTAWATLFRLVGFSRIATMILGGALVVMGLVNLKDVVWFKKGPSLVIPDRAKPGLFRRMRAIAGAASVPAALSGVLALAFVVNLIELGCTIGLPAVYTRVLTLRELSPAARYAYLALYNAAYVVPLLAIAVAFIALRRRLSMTERAAKALKAMSGALLLGFGALFLLAPDLLLHA